MCVCVCARVPSNTLTSRMQLLLVQGNHGSNPSGTLVKADVIYFPPYYKKTPHMLKGMNLSGTTFNVLQVFFLVTF